MDFHLCVVFRRGHVYSICVFLIYARSTAPLFIVCGFLSGGHAASSLLFRTHGRSRFGFWIRLSKKGGKISDGQIVVYLHTNGRGNAWFAHFDDFGGPRAKT